MHRLGTTLMLVTAVASAAAAMVATAGSAASARRQQIAIEERAVSGKRRGTFRLLPLAPGPLKADSGTFTFTAKEEPAEEVDGQRVTTYTTIDVLKGKRGTLTVRSETKSTNSGAGYLVGSGPWTVTRGTKAYAKARGGGAGSGVVTPRGAIYSRYEGYVSVP
jgi:hypothetical protein